MAKTFAFEFGAGFVLGLLGLFNPVTLIATIAAAFVLNWQKSQSNAMASLKKQMTEELVSSLSDQADQNAVALCENIGGRFNELADQIVDAMGIEITETERQVEGIIQEMEKGKENIAQREAVIKNCEARIKELSSQLDNLIFQLVEV